MAGSFRFHAGATFQYAGHGMGVLWGDGTYSPPIMTSTEARAFADFAAAHASKLEREVRILAAIADADDDKVVATAGYR